MTTPAPFCYVCRRTDQELRPYGKGGKPICFGCMKADPTREREANRRMKAAMDRACAGDSLPVIGGAAGPERLEDVEARGDGDKLIFVDTRTGRPPVKV